MSVAKYRSGETIYYVSDGQIINATIISSTIYPGDEQAVYEVAENSNGRVRKEMYEEELFTNDVLAADSYKKKLLTSIYSWESLKESARKEIERIEIRYKV